MPSQTACFHDEKKVFGVVTDKGEKITSKATIITTGTYMESTIISGEDVHPGGPDGEPSSQGLSGASKKWDSIFSGSRPERRPGSKKNRSISRKPRSSPAKMANLAFSFTTTKFTPLKDQLPCWLIYTSPETFKIIRDNLDKSAIFNGVIKGVGPRYCPAIESKVVRFADKPRHQLFLEPEFEFGDSIYLQGFLDGHAP
jgi:tRNA uridine 5-carboxymethylaminomethyl modification enzyme